MKKISILFCLFFTLMFTSCDMYAQLTSPFELEYEYAYNNNPVVLINGIYYWYSLVNDNWYYRPLPRECWGYIYHFDRPRRIQFHNPIRRNDQHTFNVPKIGFRGPQGEFRSSTRQTVTPQRNMQPRGSFNGGAMNRQSGQPNRGGGNGRR